MDVVLYDIYGNPVHIDQYSGALGVLEQEHLKIHAGQAFTAAARAVIADGGGVHDFLGIVPASAFPHFRKVIIGSDGGPFDIDFYEGTEVSSNGALITPFNNNRNSVNTPELVVYDAPVITSLGTLLEPVIAPGTKQAGSLGSEGSNEWILGQNTNYAVRITNNTPGGGVSNFAINMFWYE